ncbi:hypothetical protein [Vagococcus sp.]|uniref:hypothetical protein n=1 Tax=Vagococcus sp. TaxID=1933889 RepID=UPI003F9AEC9B
MEKIKKATINQRKTFFAILFLSFIFMYSLRTKTYFLEKVIFYGYNLLNLGLVVKLYKKRISLFFVYSFSFIEFVGYQILFSASGIPFAIWSWSMVGWLGSIYAGLISFLFYSYRFDDELERKINKKKG